jgi:hypothetical protein
MCVAIMFLLSWYMTLATFVIVIILYLVVVYRKPGNVDLIGGYSQHISDCCGTKVHSVRLINNIKFCVSKMEVKYS